MSERGFQAPRRFLLRPLGRRAMAHVSLHDATTAGLTEGRRPELGRLVHHREAVQTRALPDALACLQEGASGQLVGYLVAHTRLLFGEVRSELDASQHGERNRADDVVRRQRLGRARAFEGDARTLRVLLYLRDDRAVDDRSEERR